MKRVKQIMQRGLDGYLRIAVTGLSRSGKTAFISSFVNQLLHATSDAKLPLFNVVTQERLLGVKRALQSDLNVPRFAYEQSMTALYSQPPLWPEPTKGVSEISLTIRYNSAYRLRRHLQQYQTLHLELFDYPGEWLLDLPLLEQNYIEWSQQMLKLISVERQPLAQEWMALSQRCDPFAPADESLLAEISHAYTDYLHQIKANGGHFIQPGRFVLPGELEGAPALQFFPWISPLPNRRAPKNSNIAVLKQRYDYYCKHIVGDFYRHYFSRFDRQIILVDCLQALNQGAESFNDMRIALTQLMKSFQYGKRTLLRRLFSPCIDKLMFVATKADHITADQQHNLFLLLQKMIQEAWHHAAFEGIKIESATIASIQATRSGRVNDAPAIQGRRLSDDELITLYPGDVPSSLPNKQFWLKGGFQFESFHPPQISVDSPLPHIRMDAVMQFLLGDKLR